MFDEKAVYIGAAEVCPIALVFNALDHIEHLPAIANLASDSAGGLTIEAFGINACEIPAVMARVPAAVNANIVTIKSQVAGATDSCSALDWTGCGARSVPNAGPPR